MKVEKCVHSFETPGMAEEVKYGDSVYIHSPMPLCYHPPENLECRCTPDGGGNETPASRSWDEPVQSFWQFASRERSTLSRTRMSQHSKAIHLVRDGLTEAVPSRKYAPARPGLLGPGQDKHPPEPLKELARCALLLTAAGIEMPIDLEGAEFLVVCAPAVHAGIPGYTTRVMALLNAARVSYTVSSQLLEMRPAADLVVGKPAWQEVLKAWEDEAQRLGVQKILVIECGCSTRMLFTGTEAEVESRLTVPVVSFDHLMLEKIEAYELPVEPLAIPITLYDPCHLTSYTEISQMLRALLKKVTTSFVEMTADRQPTSFCMGGISSMERSGYALMQRREAVVKARQVWDTGAVCVTTPCITCMLALEDMCQTYGLNKSRHRMVFMLFEIVYEAMYQALARRGELRKARRPVELIGRDERFLVQHSISGVINTLMRSAEAETILNWLEHDAIVAQQARNHPEIMESLARFKRIYEQFSFVEVPLHSHSVGRA